LAIVHPEGWRELDRAAGTVGALRRQIETLATLASGLPDSYTVYHGVHWTRVREGHALFGEIDFAVVSPAGRLLLIEQQSGFLIETAEGLAKQYGKVTQVVPVRLARDAEALRERIELHCGGVPLDTLLYCPDYTIRQPGSAGIDPSRVVDASRRAHLVAVVRALLPEDEPADPARTRLHRFLGDQLQLVPDVDAAADQAGVLYTRLSGGLAEWARRIECAPFRLRVIGTAGSGKTQLALAAWRDALAAGRRPLYVCYNRPLADHVSLLAARLGEGGVVATYHQLCDRVLRSRGGIPDFAAADAFARLERVLEGFVPDEDWRFDELIVDEGQDFRPEWRAHLLNLLRQDGRAWWLEDPQQNLYGRTPPDFDGWVTLRADVNYRSPGDVMTMLKRLPGMSETLTAGSPLARSGLEFLTYADGADLIEKTKTAITRCVGLGYRKDMIAVVTFRGREHSAFTGLDHLGPHHLRAYTGAYDLLGNPVRTEGDIRIDSVHRFKGQAAPCVVFTEIDLADDDPAGLRKLFVGMTRATMKLILVLSERTAKTTLSRALPA